MKKKIIRDTEKQVLQSYMIIREPNQTERKKWNNLLDSHFTVPELQKLGQPLLKLVSTPSAKILMNNGTIKEVSSVFSIIKNKGNKIKTDWLQLVSFFLADEHNLTLYVSTFSEIEVVAWKLIVKKLYVNNSMLKDATGIDWITQKQTWGSYYENIPCEMASWFATTRATSDKLDKHMYRRAKDTYLFLQPAFRKVFAPILFPEVKFTLPTYKELPEQELLTFNGEADFMRCFPILQALHKQNILIMGKNKMLATTIKKASKQVNMKEFFEGDIPEMLSGIRISLTLPSVTMLLNETQRLKKNKPEDLLKIFRNNIYSYYPNLVSLLLPDINGIKSSKLRESVIGELIIDAMFIFNLYSSEWISINDLMNKLLVHPSGENSLQMFKPYQLEGMDLFNKTTGEYVHLGNLTEQLGIPFLKGLYFMLGGLGILELAYECPTEVTSSVFHSLKYVRLTELGKYVFGFIPTYTPPAIKNEQLFSLDSERLIIRSLVAGNSYESMLQDTSVPIGNHRFIMNSDSFLKNCKTEKDVNDKMDFFKKFICQKDMPEIWTEFFNSLLKQCHPLKKIPRENYAIYHLDGSNKELIHLLTTDSILKSIIIRAEGYMILVEIKNQRKLMERLKMYGYLL